MLSQESTRFLVVLRLQSVVLLVQLTHLLLVLRHHTALHLDSKLVPTTRTLLQDSTRHKATHHRASHSLCTRHKVSTQDIHRRVSNRLLRATQATASSPVTHLKAVTHHKDTHRRAAILVSLGTVLLQDPAVTHRRDTRHSSSNPLLAAELLLATQATAARMRAATCCQPSWSPLCPHLSNVSQST